MNSTSFPSPQQLFSIPTKSLPYNDPPVKSSKFRTCFLIRKITRMKAKVSYMSIKSIHISYSSRKFSLLLPLRSFFYDRSIRPRTEKHRKHLLSEQRTSSYFFLPTIHQISLRSRSCEGYSIYSWTQKLSSW